MKSSLMHSEKKTDILMLLLVEYTSNLMIKVVMDFVLIVGIR